MDTASKDKDSVKAMLDRYWFHKTPDTSWDWTSKFLTFQVQSLPVLWGLLTPIKGKWYYMSGPAAPFQCKYL